MSASLKASFPAESVDASLNDIDSKTREVAGPHDGDIRIGPFAVLNLNVNIGTSPEEAQSIVAVEPIVEAATPVPAFDPNPFNSPETLDSFVGLNDTLQWADLFGLGFDAWLEPSTDVSEGAAGLYASAENHPVEQNDVASLNQHSGIHGTVSQGYMLAVDSSQSSSGYVPLSLHDILSEANGLLKHFQSTVIPLLSSLPVTAKSSWAKINLPEAVNTLAHLTYLGSSEVTYAKQANLCGILAMSAYHLSKVATNNVHLYREDGHWQRTSHAAMSEGKTSLQQSFKNESHGPKKAKYKDQLMAVLTMVSISVSASASHSCHS